MDLVPRLATPADTGTVVELWNEASAWLKAKGSDQWQYSVRIDNIERTIAAKSLWLFDDPESGDTIATVTLDEDADDRLWSPADCPADALYLHRLVVRRSAAGQELGAKILEWAADLARSRGKTLLRLDAWNSNLGLHKYYVDRGFKPVRTVVDADVVSGALFERFIGRVPGG
jgi:GNAT superfamily N-acetyltransferase